MKTVTITPKCNSTNKEELLEFASNTYKVGMQCGQVYDSLVKCIVLTEDDFPFYISKLNENSICTKNETYIYNKGVFRPYLQELRDDEYYIEEGKCYRIETTLGYFPIFIALKTEIYKNDSPILVQELVSHQAKKTFSKDTICQFNIANIVEITDLEYTQRKQNILTRKELTKQELNDYNNLLDIAKIKPIPIEKESNWNKDVSKINNSNLIQLDNSKTNELQPFSIKLELDSLNTKPNMDLNPLN